MKLTSDEKKRILEKHARGLPTFTFREGWPRNRAEAEDGSIAFNVRTADDFRKAGQKILEQSKSRPKSA